MKSFSFHILWILVSSIPLAAWSQSTVSGTVTDGGSGFGLPGVSVIIKGTSSGTTTDFDGNYTLSGVPDGSTISYSYVGFITQEISFTGQNTINISLEEDTAQLDEVIVIGYGAVTKKDATGSVQQLSTDELNKGAIITADQLINGKSAGVRISNAGGQPDADPNIRIRGGASLSASNKPLIVIDGVPISNANPAGQSNPLALVNPNDIESFTILKDASSTAIYGSRASNGVIIITTKKGKAGAPKYSFSSSVQVGTLSKTLDLLDSEEYVQFVQQNFPEQADLLGVDGVIYNTDWQDEIYRTSISTDHIFSASGSIKDKVPFRASLGYANIQGILKESELKRYTASLNLTPRLLKDNLKVTLSAKGVLTRKGQADFDTDGNAIGDALALNPTLPVFDPAGTQPFGGFYQTLDANNDNRKIGPTNALAILKQRDRNEDVDRFIGNLELDYTLPFFTDLRAIINVGVDHSKSTILDFLDDNAINAYAVRDGQSFFNSGQTFREDQEKTDRLLDAYLSYAHDFDGFLSRLDAQAGYSYQNFENEGIQFGTTTDTEDGRRANNQPRLYFNPLNLQSFFGRVNLDFKNKYLLTASYRRDASSLFPSDRRWGNFPSAALAWKINEEKWFENVTALDVLKLRLGWGITGQQNIETTAAGFFPFTALFELGSERVQYPIGTDADGNPIFVTTSRARGFNPQLEWETTTTYNAGLDFELWRGRWGGSVDYYRRETEDLLAEIPQSEGSLINRFIQNVGTTESEGVEVLMNIIPIQTDSFRWELTGNVAFNETFVTSLDNVSQIPVADTGIGRGTGINIGAYAEGQRGRNFWLYEQLYDADGNAIQDAFVDQNGDNIINDEDRLFIPYDPKWTYGFGTQLNYKNVDFSANFRGQIGGKIYNANLLNAGFAEAVLPRSGTGFINNVIDLYDGTNYNGFQTNPSDLQALSDFYISDASFLRLDNITLGYRIDQLLGDKASMRLSFSVNNAFVITEYDGIDPENFDGIETSPYARPRTFSVGMNLDF